MVEKILSNVPFSVIAIFVSISIFILVFFRLSKD